MSRWWCCRVIDDHGGYKEKVLVRSPRSRRADDEVTAFSFITTDTARYVDVSEIHMHGTCTTEDRNTF